MFLITLTDYDDVCAVIYFGINVIVFFGDKLSNATLMTSCVKKC